MVWDLGEDASGSVGKGSCNNHDQVGLYSSNILGEARTPQVGNFLLDDDDDSIWLHWSSLAEASMSGIQQLLPSAANMPMRLELESSVLDHFLCSEEQDRPFHFDDTRRQHGLGRK